MSYPEHEKLQAISPKSQVIGEFLEWLSRQGYTICRWQDEGNNGEPPRISATDEDLERIRAEDGSWAWAAMQAAKRGVPNPAYEAWPEGFFPARRPITDYLADYFGIDQEALEAEKRHMLNALRAANGA